jgi:hypothetical protein
MAGIEERRLARLNMTLVDPLLGANCPVNGLAAFFMVALATVEPSCHLSGILTLTLLLRFARMTNASVS